MASQSGFPPLPNATFGIGFDPAIASNLGFNVFDVTNGASSLVILQADTFTLGVKLITEGIQPSFWHANPPGPTFNINYFAESLTSGTAKLIGTIALTFPQGTLIAGSPGTPPQVVFDTTVTTVTLTGSAIVGLVGAGALKLTAIASFNGAFPFSSFITDLVMELF